MSDTMQIDDRFPYSCFVQLSSNLTSDLIRSVRTETLRHRYRKPLTPRHPESVLSLLTMCPWLKQAIGHRQ
ncbi:hypothetical protein J6590_074553 [Homalodisca vitripennis]|nr:hypothetical protein J6590_074553 [Homalodisca vitripennis]